MVVGVSGIPINLNTMIAEVEHAHPDGEPLDLLERAIALAGGFTELSDHLIGHFVDHARDQGLSWTQIGERLGVSKQAVRKRFAPDDLTVEAAAAKQKAFDRYTPAAHHAIELAHDIAQRRHHHVIGTGHILLGVCRETSGTGVQIIEAQGLAVYAVERAVFVRLDEPEGEPPDHIPFDDDAKKVLELTARAALRLGHERVDTGHLLLGLLWQKTGTAAGVLAEMGLGASAVEGEVVRRGAGPAGAG
jgi:hypothetical protein